MAIVSPPSATIDDSPLDGETPYWLFSLLFHVALLVGLSILFIDFHNYEQVTVELSPYDLSRGRITYRSK